MDFAESIIQRIEGETRLKNPINVLACYSNPDTGKRLSLLTTPLVHSRSEKSSITYLFLSEKNNQGSEGVNSSSPDFTHHKGGRNELTIRSFTLQSENPVQDILRISQEQECNLVIAGINNDQLSLHKFQEYCRLKSNPANSESGILEQFEPRDARILNGISSLIELNPVATGLFIDRGLVKVKNIFIPILCPADMLILPLVYIRFAQDENIKLLIWDAIGIFESDLKKSRFFQSLVKKTDERVSLWDNNKKIEQEIIDQQDLLVAGFDGWSKLVKTPLSWGGSLPSTLVIKDKTT